MMTVHIYSPVAEPRRRAELPNRAAEPRRRAAAGIPTLPMYQSDVASQPQERFAKSQNVQHLAMLNFDCHVSQNGSSFVLQLLIFAQVAPNKQHPSLHKQKPIRWGTP
jgi:hypothetical protein